MARRGRVMPSLAAVAVGGTGDPQAFSRMTRMRKSSPKEQKKVHQANLPRAMQLAKRAGIKPPWEG